MLITALLATALLPAAALAETLVFPNKLLDGPVTAESTSTRGHIDWPKLAPGVNESSYDCHYFDVVSPDAKSSVAVVSYLSGPKGITVVIIQSSI